MDDERYIGGLQKSEIIGGLCLLAIVLLGWLPWSSWLPTIRLFGAGMSLRTELIVVLVKEALCLLTLLPLLRRYLLEQTQLLVESGWNTLKQLLLGLLLGYLLVFFMRPILIIVLDDVPDYSNQNQTFLELLFSRYPVWVWVMTCVTGPVIEELLFRGVVFCGLYPHSRLLAYLLSSLAFAIPHVSKDMFQVPAEVTVVYLLFYFLAGLNLARTYERSGNLFTSILLHAGYNIAVTLLAF